MLRPSRHLVHLVGLATMAEDLSAKCETMVESQSKYVFGSAFWTRFAAKNLEFQPNKYNSKIDS
jgi:hypothetical protein